MIRVRFSHFEKTGRDKEFSIVVGDSLSNSVSKIFSEKDIDQNTLIVSVNGFVVPKDLWPDSILKGSENILIVPNLASGDSSQNFAQILSLVALAAVAPYTLPIAQAGFLGGVGAGLINAGVMIIAGYVASQLVPPPNVGAGGGVTEQQEESQMYSISSQGNSARKYAFVPKVYGEHKMFPNVAANPYTELEVDPATGKLAQYLYAIYDFGFGPNVVRDIKIGETPIDFFTEADYRLVDLNKPVVSEGIWDDDLSNQFIYYKGDIETESVGTVLDGNQSAGDAQSRWQLIRNAPANNENKDQDISINFVCPEGLYAFNSTGLKSTRTIELRVEFSKVGEDIWRSYNDSDYVKSYSAAGGDTTTEDAVLSVAPAPDPSAIFRNWYATVYASPYTVGAPANAGQSGISKRFISLGFQAGATFIRVPDTLEVVVGDTLKYKFFDVGVIASIVPVMGNPTYKQLNLVSPLPVNVTIYSYEETREDYYLFPESPIITYELIDTKQLKKKGTPPGILRITSDSRSPIYGSVKFSPRQIASYKIRVTRTSTTSLYSTQVADTLSLATIVTRTDTAPIVTDKRHTFMEVRIKATGQLNGSIQNLSAICASVLDVYDGTTWTKQVTNNPAWIFADLLTGEVSKKPVAKTRLDTASLLEWAERCDEIPTSSAIYTFLEKRFTCNFVLDFKTTLQQILQQVAGAAQASLNIVDGKYGVLIDKNRTIPVQIFTPRNSSGFSSTRVYTEKPDGLRVSYIDPYSNWQTNVLTVFDDGKTEENSEVFQDISSFGITQVEQAWRFGRYFLAQNKLRQEVITLRVDFENLVCTRGDFVQITQDVMRVGGTAARVRSVDGNEIIIDEGIETGVDDYGFVFRGSDGNIRTGTLTVVNSTTFELDGIYIPLPGDLIVIGVVDEIVFDCIVKSIQPQDNLSAILTLVEKAEALYTIEEVDEIPGYSPKISGTTDPDFGVPAEVPDLLVVANSYNIKQSGYEYYIDLDWENPLGAATEIFEVYVDFGTGYDLVTSTKASDYRYIVDEDNLDILHSFKILAVSATGKKLGLGEVTAVTATPLTKTARPSDVTTFNSDITGEVLQLFWTRVPDLDIKEYVIRYSPSVSGAWENSTGLMRVGGTTSLIATQARTGSYFIKAVDFNNNESTEAGTIITTIPSLNGLNIIDSKNDFPALDGSKDRVEKSGDTLVLAQSVIGTPGNEQYYSEGFYYYEELLDLGDIYTVRLQSLLSAEGFVSTDIMANWDPLSDIPALAGARSSEWDVEAQYRASNSLNVIANWTDLTSIAAMNEGSTESFTEWRKFIIGDATGRVFQFRLKLSSNALAVTPRVLDGEIKADMPDRTDYFDDVLAPDTGVTVTYDPAYKGPGTSPSVQISINDAQSGDYPEYTSKTLDGFTVVFKDNSGNPVARSFDALVKGFGKKGINTI